MMRCVRPRCRVGLGAWLALAAVVPATARAEAPVFVWADKDGALHVTDRLGDVPEPYYTVYAERLKEQLERQGRLPQAAPPEVAASPPSAPAVAASPASVPAVTGESEFLRRKMWRELMAKWRGELAVATAELQKIEQEAAEAGMNPVLRQTPQVQAQLDAIGSRRDAARTRVLKARAMLLEVLPKRARDERVPPQWLL
jgi:hypothetical protein